MAVHDLDRAGISIAATVVIFGSVEFSAGASTLSADADSICLYRLVCARNPRVEPVCVVHVEGSVAFMSSRSWLGAGDFHREPCFAAGHVVTPSMMDLLLCQSFFNPHVRAHTHGGARGADARRCVTLCVRRVTVPTERLLECQALGAPAGDDTERFTTAGRSRCAPPPPPRACAMQ